MKKHIILFLIIAGVIFPTVSFAAIPDFNGPLVICGREGQKACTLCDVFVMAQKIIDYIIGLIAIIAPIFIAIGGFMILFHGADPGQVESGKKIIKSAVIGLIIALLAWTVINIIFNTFVSEDTNKFPGPWNQIKCEGGGEAEQEKLIEEKESEKSEYDWCKGPDLEGSENWIISGIDPGQKTDPTQGLVDLLNCMYKEINSGLTITSISDDKLCSGVCTPSTGAGCSHTANSCHYGGTKCAGRSYAVDFATNVSCSIIRDVALSCNSSAWVNWEGNHTHVSIYNTDCGCAESGSGNPCPQ